MLTRLRGCMERKGARVEVQTWLEDVGVPVCRVGCVRNV